MNEPNQTQPQKKPFYKKWWFWIGGFALFMLIGLMAPKRPAKPAPPTDTTEVVKAEEKPPTPKEEPTVEVAKPVEPAPTETEEKPVQEEEIDTGITMENFAKIKDGMTRAEVEKYLGKGELFSSAGSGEYLTETYNYKKKGLFSVKIVTVTFQNGKVMAKAQIGL